MPPAADSQMLRGVVRRNDMARPSRWMAANSERRDQGEAERRRCRHRIAGRCSQCRGDRETRCRHGGNPDADADHFAPASSFASTSRIASGGTLGTPWNGRSVATISSTTLMITSEMRPLNTRCITKSSAA